MPTFSYNKWSVLVASDGKILVKKGDTISGYCAAIYQKSPSTTQSHWGEFARKAEVGAQKGQLVQISDPAKITAGEVIYHSPSAAVISTTPNTNSQAVADALLVKLNWTAPCLV